MANAVGTNAAAKSLASNQGKLAMKKLMNGESVDINDIFKATLTNGPNAYNTNINDIVKLVQDEKAPTNNTLIYDTFDYIMQNLASRKTDMNALLAHESHGLKPDEIEIVENDIQLCDLRNSDIMKLKDILKYHIKVYTKQSILHWLRLVFLNEWPKATMTQNNRNYSHVLVPIPPTVSRSNKTKTTPSKQPGKGKSRKRTTTSSSSKTVKKEYTDAQDMQLAIFKDVCWYYNWRKQKCIFGKNCNKDHICSIENCGSKDHRACEHK